MVLVRRKRKTRKNARKRKTVTRRRTRPAVKRKAVRRRKVAPKRKATRRKRRKGSLRYGTYRPVLKYTNKGWRRPKRSRLMRKATRVNPRRRRRTRRNPSLNLRTLFAKRNLIHITAVAGGIAGGMLAVPAILRVAPQLGEHRQFLGGIPLVLGLGIGGMARKPAIKTAGMTLAAVGLYDLISQLVTALRLPTLPESAMLLDSLAPESTEADFMSAESMTPQLDAPGAYGMNADFMSADAGSVISEMTF